MSKHKKITPHEALCNISVTCDELGMMPTIPTVEDYDRHFADVFRIEFDIIEEALMQLNEIKRYADEQLSKAYDEYSKNYYDTNLTEQDRAFYGGMRHSVLATRNDLKKLLGDSLEFEESLKLYYKRKQTEKTETIYVDVNKLINDDEK